MSKTQAFDNLRLIDRIGRRAISPGAAALLSYVQRLQRAKKWHFASGDALAAVLKVSRRSVLRYVAELEKAGLLAVWRRIAFAKDANGFVRRRKISCGYRVMGEALREAAEVGAAVRGEAVSVARRARQLAQKVSDLVVRCCARGHSCDTVSQLTRPEFKKEAERLALYRRVGTEALTGVQADAIYGRIAELEAELFGSQLRAVP